MEVSNRHRDVSMGRATVTRPMYVRDVRWLLEQLDKAGKLSDGLIRLNESLSTLLDEARAEIEHLKGES
jgi:hypothetical protein